MNLSHLYYFKKLAEVQHYSKAAKELFISQPTLSSAISSLEKELDVQLFERDGRSIHLTRCGEIFYDHVRASLRELDDGLAALKDERHLLKGTINLGAIFTVQDDYLPRLLRDFLRSYGDTVLFKTYQNFTNALIKGLHEGTIDVAFCGKREQEPDIEYYPVKGFDLRFCVRRDHPLALREHVSVEDIRPYTVYSYATGTPIGEQTTELIQKFKLDNVVQLYREDVAMGSFIAYSEDENLGALMLDSVGMKLFPDLVAIPVDELPGSFYQAYLAYSTKRAHSQVVEQFIDFVKRHAGYLEDGEDGVKPEEGVR